MDRARQIIYSVFMGFVLTLFLQNSYKIYLHWRELFKGMEKLEIFPYISIIYGIILIYFCLNAFRYIFGIFEFLENIDNQYEPKKQDWKFNFKTIFKNLGKQFVLNSGLFIVLLFAVLSQMLFPSSIESFNPSNNEIIRIYPIIGELQITNIFSKFIYFILAITLIDFLSTLFYSLSKYNSNSEERVLEILNQKYIGLKELEAEKITIFKNKILEDLTDKKIEIGLWLFSGIIEIIIIGFFILFFETGHYDLVKGTTYVLMIFLIIEYSGIFNYAKRFLSKFKITKVD